MHILKVFTLTLGLASSLAGAAPIGPITHERSDLPMLENSTTGRYLYVGATPNFEARDIELTVSKMGLTLRVQAWVSKEKIASHARTLYRRWKKLDQTLKDPNYKVHPLVRISDMAIEPNDKAWAKIAEQYTSHVLDNQGVQIYNDRRNLVSLEESGTEIDYKNRISTAVLRYYLQDPTLEQKDLPENSPLIAEANSLKVFEAHYKNNFTKSSERDGFEGYLTLVYPIAAHVGGPFDQPKEGVHSLLSSGTINARAWSNRWKDAFAGMPFLLVTDDGVAFHGPISNYQPLDVWFLRRGYVSHGCHRMDSSDILELRNMLPVNVRDLNDVKVTVLDNFDVTDWDLDGEKEIMDVKYYNVPTSVDLSYGASEEEIFKQYSVETQSRTFFQEHEYTNEFYDPETDTFKKTPKYEIDGEKLKKHGKLRRLHFKRFAYQPNRILQYKELEVAAENFDDALGKYPPAFFMDHPESPVKPEVEVEVEPETEIEVVPEPESTPVETAPAPEAETAPVPEPAPETAPAPVEEPKPLQKNQIPRVKI